MSRFPLLPVAIAVLLAFGPLARVVAAGNEPARLVIDGATLLDGTGAPPVPDARILIADGRIEAITAAGDEALPDGYLPVDGRGKFIVPGLVDAHAHIDSTGGIALTESQAALMRGYIPRAFLYHGVTTVLNLSAHDLDHVLDLRERARSDPHGLLPRIYTASATFTAQDGWGARHGGGVTSAEQIEARLEHDERHGIDLVKIIIEDGLGEEPIFPRIEDRYLRAIAAISAAHDWPLFVHATDAEEYRRALRLHPAAIAHGLFTPQPADSPVIRALRDQGTVVVPTIVLFEAFYRLRDNPALLDDPRLIASVPDFVLEAMRDPAVIAAAFGRMDDVLRMDSSAWARSAVASLIDNTARFAEAGIPIAAGTDGGGAVVHSFQGYNLPRELEILAGCCLSNHDTLIAASATAARTIGAGDTFGSLTPGASADLLLLNADPLEDIRAVRDFDRLVLRGRLVERSDLTWAAFAAEPR